MNLAKPFGEHEESLHTDHDEAVHILQNILACRVCVKSFSCEAQRWPDIAILIYRNSDSFKAS